MTQSEEAFHLTLETASSLDTRTLDTTHEIKLYLQSCRIREMLMYRGVMVDRIPRKAIRRLIRNVADSFDVDLRAPRSTEVLRALRGSIESLIHRGYFPLKHGARVGFCDVEGCIFKCPSTPGAARGKLFEIAEGKSTWTTYSAR
jgi:hypothetical protein